MCVDWKVLGLNLSLLVLLAVTGCGPSPNNADGGTGCTEGQKGCVDLLNFTAAPTSIAPPGQTINVPAATVSSSSTAPGTGSYTLGSSAVGSSQAFQATANGRTVSVTCTLTSQAWAGADVNPEVVLQPSGNLSCVLW